MKGPDEAEVALIEGENAIGAVARGEDHDGEIGQSHVEVRVAVVQCERGEVIGWLKAGHFVSTGSQITQEKVLLPPKPARRVRK